MVATAVKAQVSCKVAGYAKMRSAVDPVGSQAYFKYGIANHVEVFTGRSARHGTIVENHNTLMISPESKLILGTDHALRHFAPDLCLFQFDCFLPYVKSCSGNSHGYFLPGSHIRRSANNTERFRLTNVNCCYGKLVGIRMFFTTQDFPDNHTFKSAPD